MPSRSFWLPSARLVASGAQSFPPSVGLGMASWGCSRIPRPQVSQTSGPSKPPTCPRSLDTPRCQDFQTPKSQDLPKSRTLDLPDPRAQIPQTDLQNPLSQDSGLHLSLPLPLQPKCLVLLHFFISSYSKRPLCWTCRSSQGIGCGEWPSALRPQPACTPPSLLS